MDATSAHATLASDPLRPTEWAYSLVAALLDPDVRAFLNSKPKASVELHWDAAAGQVVTTVRHSAKYVVRVGPPIPRSTR